MMSESGMVHRLWNILEGEVYSVGGEVRVVPAKRKKLRKWTLITDRKGRIMEGIDEERGLTLSGKEIELGVASGRFHLTAENNTKLVIKERGFPKDSLTAVGACCARKQLEAYTSGGMLDEVYLVVPYSCCEQVNSYYGRYLGGIGVGLAAIDDHLKIVFRSAKHPRHGEPELKENEAWLRQMFWNHFESKYAVEGEGVVPRLREGLRKYSASRALLGSIDLFLLPKGSTITDVAFNQDKSESIGIEVKYKIKSENKLKKTGWHEQQKIWSPGLRRWRCGNCSGST